MPKESRLHKHNRFFTNWYLARIKLIESSIHPVIHRIGSKRVVLEVSIGAQRNKRRGSKPRHIIFVVFALTATVSSIAFLAFSNSGVAQVREGGGSAKETDLCAQLDSGLNINISNVEQFRIGTWLVTTYGEALTNGAIWSLRFEATCGDKSVLGRLKIAKNTEGFSILQMTPIQ